MLIALVAMAAGGCQKKGTGAGAVEFIVGKPGLAPGEFNYPRAIAASPVDGRVFVCDKTARIQRFGPDGRFETGWRMPDYRNGMPTGLHVDAQNRVWVADTHYARVICYDRDGRELFRFGSHGEGPGQFIFPTCVLVDRLGFIYVGEYGGNDRISKFSPQRQYLFSFADKASGEGWTDRPTEVLIDAQGVLWVADSCNHRICRYTSDGRFISAIALEAGGESELSYPYGMSFEKSGTLLVMERGRNRLVRLDAQGNRLASWGTAGREPGQLLQPWGVAVTPDGRIWCLDSWNNRVQVIDW